MGLTDAIFALVHSRRRNIKSKAIGLYDFNGWPAGTKIFSVAQEECINAPCNHYILRVQIAARECEEEYFREFDESADKPFINDETLDEIYDDFKAWFDVVWPVKQPSFWSKVKNIFRNKTDAPIISTT